MSGHLLWKGGGEAPQSLSPWFFLGAVNGSSGIEFSLPPSLTVPTQGFKYILL